VKVPIQNLYYLFCYAWRFLPDDLAIDVGGVGSPDVLNMCAHVLTSGIDRLLRRGIDQGYVVVREETSRLRGRINVTATISELSWLHARAVCEYDELTPNTVNNRILRSTVRLLSNAQLEPDLAKRLREVDRRLSGIGLIDINPSLFRRIQLHRNNAFYAFLLRICELVNQSLLPDRSGDNPSWFRDLLSDEEYMARVFEEFMRNFYNLKQSRFAVARTQPKWNASAVEVSDLHFLPTMMTDATLRSTDRQIVIDAKYYRDALQTNFGTRRVHSGNLYQLLAYLHGTAPENHGTQSIEGMLVYPAGEQELDLSYTIDGYKVRIYTLNLAQPWHQIESDLLSLIA
jgi:5-methylcytosine-specific restriction enzyme subunit McrC